MYNFVIKIIIEEVYIRFFFFGSLYLYVVYPIIQCLYT